VSGSIVHRTPGRGGAFQPGPPEAAPPNGASGAIVERTGGEGIYERKPAPKVGPKVLPERPAEGTDATPSGQRS
jgi:hypothetical protein